MLEDSQFHCLTDAYLDSLVDEIEAKDPKGIVDADIADSALTITLESGDQFVVSKHAPSHQLWLSSPVSGGLHFSYNESDSLWQLDDGRKLGELLAKELGAQTGLKFEFAQ